MLAQAVNEAVDAAVSADDRLAQAVNQIASAITNHADHVVNARLHADTGGD